MSKSKVRFIWVIFFFLAIFNPCLIKIPMYYCIFGLEIFYILYFTIVNKKILIHRPLLKILGGFVPFLVYYTILTVVHLAMDNNHSYYMSDYRNIIFNCIYCITSTFVISMLQQRKNLKIEDFYNIISIVGVIQLMCVLLAFFSPTVKSIFNTLTVRNSQNDAIIAFMNKSWYMTWRAYGFAENLFDGFGYIISIVILITFAVGVDKKNLKTSVLVLAMLFMPLVNARTGLVLCIITAIVILCFYFDVRKIFKYLIIVLALVISVYMLFAKLPEQLQSTLLDGIDQTKTLLLGGETEGVYSEIFGADLVFPQDIILGAGSSPEKLAGYAGIDSGYIQCLWRFGIVGCILLFGAFINAFLITYRCTNLKLNKCIITATTIVFFVYLFKLYSINSYSNNFLLFSVIAIIISTSNTSINEYF